ncbi:acyl-CoA N-acyltransferase [Achaetomium macrosporum]|uniref:Acyl-CoA N-acyltransferase n=1 Tax=Achaetomium macrosporum TaxID=79813 RepID=A0AAN7CDV6_9PEZI|nr:acyl-CoA N-acyltransferase [Achaetomium macrosporum]
MASASVTADPAPAPAPALPEGYTLRPGYPPIPAYLHLRAAAGLTPKTAAQAKPVAQHSWYGCYITFSNPSNTDNNNEGTADKEEEIVAMGRIIGDGGWYFHIADMAVLPTHQRKGLGDAVLKDLLRHIKEHAPQDGTGAYVTLFADGPGRKLYAKNGFVEALPSGQLGMMLPMGWEGR